MLKRPTMAPVGDLVVLLDEAGRPIGSHDRVDVHGDDTPLHLAFSSYLFDADGRVLLTRRALHKATWPGVWTNSCCGHPRPGEQAADAVRRRIREELGLEVERVRLVLPDFRYRATDASGIVENELCPVYVAEVADPQRLTPDPDEVMDHSWLPWSDLVAVAAAAPQALSPWAVLQIPQLAAALPVGPAVRPAPSPADTQARLDAALVEESRKLRALWLRSAPADSNAVLALDLPDWLERLAGAGGKRFRARLSHWAFVACGGAPDSPAHDHLIQVSVALELLHLFALVHDDVMDSSDSRRGHPSAHVQAAGWHRDFGAQGDADEFGRNLAILLGDLAHAQADRLAYALPRPLAEAWYDLTIELIAGQRADLTGAAERRRDLAHAERVAELKSGGYSVERPLQLGALAAAASAEQRAALSGYGRHLGRAFALRDDLLGVWGDPAVTGKPAGDDLRSAKATVILALAQQTLTGSDAVALARLGGPEATEDDVAALQQALVVAGVRDRVEAMIADEVALARGVLDRVAWHPDGRAGLLQLAEQIAWRQA